MDIVQVLLLTLVIQASAEYYISSKTSNWKEAVETCNTAIPNLQLTDDGYKIKIDYKPIEGDVWLGYFMKMTVFDYIGCVKLTNQRFSKLGERNTPGLCYSFCKGNELIGVSIDKCICVDTLGNFSKHEVECTLSCGPRMEGIACGGNGYMSVYKVNKNAITSDRQNTCLSFQQYGQNKHFKWTNCSEYFRVVCKNGSAIQNSHPWLISMNECFKMGYLPISYRNLRDIKTNIDPFWSGVITSDVFYNYTAWDGNSQGVRFGYLSSKKSVYFTDTDDLKLALCTSSDAERGNSTKADAERGNSTKGQTVSIIIGVSVCACVVIIAVVAFIILKRRGKLPSLRTVTKTCCPGQDVMTKDKINQPSTMLPVSSPKTVHSKQECESYTNRSYSVLEPRTTEHSMQDINSRERNEPIDTESMYNDIDPEPDSNTAYARVDKKKRSSLDLDGDYDTTETTAKKLEGKAEYINGEYAELENDAYSHIGKSPASVGTDQTYNILHHDDSHSKTDEKHDGKDTYSHLDSKQSGCSSNNPENVYHTTNGFKDTNI